MKRGILLAVLLLCASSAYAAIFDETIFDEKLVSSGSYSASNGENFTIDLINDRISFKYDGGAFIVRNASCDSDDRYEVCLSVTEFSHYNYNYTGEKIVNFRHVTISTFLAELSINRTFEKTEFWPGESSMVTTKIQNIGQRPAPVAFSDNFSSAFEVALPLECSLKGNAIVWKGTLSPMEVAVCIYRITALSPGDYTSVAEASFSNTLVEKTSTDTVELSTHDFSLLAQVNVSNSTVRIGGTFFVNITLSSSQDIYLKHYRIEPGEGVAAVSSSGFTSSGSVLEYDGKVSSPVQLYAVFRAEQTGNLTVASNAVFDILLNNSRIKQEFTRYEGISAWLENVTVYLPVNETSNGGSFNIIITNPSKRDIRNVAIHLSSNASLSNPDAFFDTIGFHEFRDFTTTITSPYTENRIAVELSYQSPYGEQFAAVSVQNVTVTDPAPLPEESSVPDTSPEETSAESSIRYPSVHANLSASAVIAATAIVLIIAAIILFLAKRKGKKASMSDFDSLYRSNLFERK